ncbi:hypothetical protein AV530_019634 [Patagioenas fasciata monilis]|uniref:Uncharacterized protein n=1 Tax=Patagioenas fasciata monilis TaxID=372326 RepID=A0A1V4JFE5_PATFA|nr:hypothetical protein AV530_019634 [Patagioenas fasciata monilis]
MNGTGIISFLPFRTEQDSEQPAAPQSDSGAPEIRNAVLTARGEEHSNLDSANTSTCFNLNERYLVGFQIAVSEEILTETQIYTGSDGNSDIWAENQLASNEFKKKMTKDATRGCRLPKPPPRDNSPALMSAEDAVNE